MFTKQKMNRAIPRKMMNEATSNVQGLQDRVNVKAERLNNFEWTHPLTTSLFKSQRQETRRTRLWGSHLGWSLCFVIGGSPKDDRISQDDFPRLLF
jgi:hypothetical protein